MAIDESALIASCQAGHLDDFDPLYRAYVKPIYGFISRRTMLRDVADDLTSDTFMKALEKIGSYSTSKGPFIAWLYTIARNTVTDYYRRNHPHEDIETVWDLSSDEHVPSTIDDRMNFEKVRAALQKLDPLKRDIVMMRLWDGLSYDEISAIVGKSSGNCKVIFCRTLESLRTELPLGAFLLFFFFSRFL